MTMEDDILIDDYLKGLLSDDEVQSFLARVNNDSEFKEKFELEHQLFEALNEDSWNFQKNANQEIEDYKSILQGDDLQTLKKVLNSANSDFNAQSKVRNLKPFYYLAAASIVLFLGFQLFLNQNVSNQDLYNDFVGLNDLPSFVSRSDSESQLIEAQKLFEDKNYSEALNVFRTLEDDIAQNANVFIYKGISEMQLGEFKAAEQTFDELIESNLLDANKGYWYKALLNLKQDRIEACKDILGRIISEKLYNFNKAKELLKELE